MASHQPIQRLFRHMDQILPKAASFDVTQIKFSCQLSILSRAPVVMTLRLQSAKDRVRKPSQWSSTPEVQISGFCRRFYKPLQQRITAYTIQLARLQRFYNPARL